MYIFFSQKIRKKTKLLNYHKEVEKLRKVNASSATHFTSSISNGTLNDVLTQLNRGLTGSRAFVKRKKYVKTGSDVDLIEAKKSFFNFEKSLTSIV